MDTGIDNWFEWDLLNFDKIKEYLRFYFHNNVTQVLDEMPRPKVLAGKKKKRPDKKQSKLKMSINWSNKIIGEKSGKYLGKVINNGSGPVVQQ